MKDGDSFLILWYLLIFFLGIDTSFSYIEGVVTNITDQRKFSRGCISGIVCLFGIAVSTIFTSNFGWAMFDMVEHYISNYIIILIGLLQCIAVGW